VPEPGASVTVIGVADDTLETLSAEAREALRRARLVIGGRRHLDAYARWSPTPAETLEITADTEGLMGRIRGRVGDGTPMCVLASGDPGFFGILRALLRHLDRHQLRVLPAPSSVATAFARLSLPWDDALVVSAHGRPLDDAVRAARTGRKVAVLTAPESPPEQLGKALVAAGCTADLVAVCSRLGTAEESVRELTLGELAEGRFDPLSVVVVVGPGGLPLTGWAAGDAARRSGDRVLAWGRDDARYEHRAGMITKAETRAVILGKLGLPERGVLWDVGAGSGSVAIESARLCPELTVFAIEADPEAAARIGTNAAEAGAGVHVIAGTAPDALADLPAPDRAFVGGGGTGVLRAVLERLMPGGHVVASFASLDRAVEGAGLLGHLIQVRSDRGERLPDGSWRLAAHNPVFVAWGPAEEPGP